MSYSCGGCCAVRPPPVQFEEDAAEILVLVPGGAVLAL